jgi:hypothetical protein
MPLGTTVDSLSLIRTGNLVMSRKLRVSDDTDIFRDAWRGQRKPTTNPIARNTSIRSVGPTGT